jgi:transposase
MKNKYYKPYDNKTRDHAFSLIKKKKKLKYIAELLHVSVRTLLRWKKLAKNGQKYAKVNYKRGKKPHINDKVMLLLIKNYPDAKQRELSNFYFDFTGISVSQPSISKFIKKVTMPINNLKSNKANELS